MRARIALSVIGLSVALASPVETTATQIVHGRILEDGTDRPLMGALVVLLDEDGKRRAGTETRRGGAFALKAPGAGTYRIVVLLTGYQSTTSPPLRVGMGPTLPIDIAIVESQGAQEARAFRAEVREAPSSAIPARRDAPPGILGHVVDAGTGEPVTPANLTLLDREGVPVAAGPTDPAGNFELVPPAPGVFDLKIARIGYTPGIGEVTFAGDRSVFVEVAVSMLPVTLDPLVVVERATPAPATLGLAGFLARREKGLGHFYDREAIERRRPSRVSGLLAGTPGVRMVGGATHPDVRFLGTDRFLRDCRPSIWVDGYPVRHGGESQLNDPGINDLTPPPSMIEAVELYRRPAEVPVQFNEDGMCGVIVIWTRRGSKGGA